VQHAKTGELVPVVVGGSAGADESEQDDADKNNAVDPARQLLLPPLPPPLNAGAHDVESGQAYASSAMAAAQFDEATHSFDDTVVLIRSAFLFAQGLLAGFCFTTISTQTAAVANDADFLIGYQPNAMQYRRLFYLLSTISVVGSIDTFMSITSKVTVTPIPKSPFPRCALAHDPRRRCSPSRRSCRSHARSCGKRNPAPAARAPRCPWTRAGSSSPSAGRWGARRKGPTWRWPWC